MRYNAVNGCDSQTNTFVTKTADATATATATATANFDTSNNPPTTTVPIANDHDDDHGNDDNDCGAKGDDLPPSDPEPTPIAIEEPPVPASQQQQQQQENQEEYNESDPQLEVFDPFDSAMEDTTSGPMQPLVAPLKLSSPKPSVSSFQSTPLPITGRSSLSSSSSFSTVPSVGTNGFDDLVDSLQAQLQNVEREINVMVSSSGSSDDDSTTTTTTINLNSPKQVSQLLFGRPDMSTNKSTLEGMAGSNVLAKLVLEYRDVKRRLNKILKNQEVQQEKEQRQQKQQQRQEQAITSGSSTSPSRRTTTSDDPVLLFDTSSFIFRAYYSTPPIHRGRDGMPIGAVMGFCSMMNKLLLTSMLKGETPRLVHCLDAPGPSFRNDLYPDYKAHRPPCPLDLVPQFGLINKAARAYGMVQIQADGYEADDVIATLATIGSQKEGLDVRILSGDKDLMQLVTEHDDCDYDNNNDEDMGGVVHMMDPMTSKLWTHEMVREKWGVKASQLGDVLALAGDSADNIPGVPGIGPKIAAQLLDEFETLEHLLENTNKVPQAKRREKLEVHADSARISRELVELQRDLEWSQLRAFHPPEDGDEFDDGSGGSEVIAKALSEDTLVGELRMERMNADRILAFYDEMGFFTLKQRLLDRLAASSKTTGTTTTSAPARSITKTKKKNVPRKSDNGNGGDNSNKNNSSSNNSRKADTEKIAQQPSVSSPKASADKKIKEAATSATTTTTKPPPKRNFWEKFKRGVPTPDQFKDVPF